MTHSTKVLAVAGDPGGARALEAVLHTLPIETTIYAYNQAVKIFQENSAICDKVILLAETPSLNAALAILDAEQPTVVFGATSFNDKNWERLFYQAAKLRKIPSLALLDFWGNYRERFSSDGNNLDSCPDRISIMDTLAQDEMIALGFPKEILTITGQPVFDKLIQLRKPSYANERTAFQSRYDIIADYYVLFASQPIRMLKDKGFAGGAFLPYDECVVFQAIQSAIQSLSLKCGLNIQLLLRLHPRENPEDWASVFNQFSYVHDISSLNSVECLQVADLVVGMNSVFLFEAACMLKNVMSIQPDCEHHDALPTHASDCTLSIYDLDTVEPILQRFLQDSAFQQAQRQRQELYFSSTVNATDNVVALLTLLGGGN